MNTFLFLDVSTDRRTMVVDTGRLNLISLPFFDSNPCQSLFENDFFTSIKKSIAVFMSILCTHFLLWIFGNYQCSTSVQPSLYVSCLKLLSGMMMTSMLNRMPFFHAGSNGGVTSYSYSVNTRTLKRYWALSWYCDYEDDKYTPGFLWLTFKLIIFVIITEKENAKVNISNKTSTWLL